MKEIFPIEIVEYSNEAYWTRRNVKSKAIYIAIICVLLVTLFSLPFIYIEVSSQSRGSVKSISENNTLQSVVSSEIRRIHIQENQEVKKGDTLVWLQTNVIEEQISRLEEKQLENDAFIQDLDNLIAGRISYIITPKYRSEYSRYQSKVREEESVLSKAEYEYNTLKGLYEKGVESQFEYEQATKNYNTAGSRIVSLKREYNSSWQSERTRLEFENRDLYSEIQRLEKEKSQYYITAPMDGNIVQYIGVRENSFILAGQTLAQIVSDDDLIAECYVSPIDIGYVHEGQMIKLQFDSFDYRQWGLLEGKVLEIIPDVISIDDKPFFRVRCSMERNYLKLKNGYEGNLKKGMTFTARFVMTKRSLGQLLFDKIDNWINPKIIRHGD